MSWRRPFVAPPTSIARAWTRSPRALRRRLEAREASRQTRAIVCARPMRRSRCSRLSTTWKRTCTGGGAGGGRSSHQHGRHGCRHEGRAGRLPSALAPQRWAVFDKLAVLDVAPYQTRAAEINHKLNDALQRDEHVIADRRCRAAMRDPGPGSPGRGRHGGSQASRAAAGASTSQAADTDPKAAHAAGAVT